MERILRCTKASVIPRDTLANLNLRGMIGLRVST